MYSVSVHAIFLAVYSFRAINNPSFVVRIKYLQCKDGFLLHLLACTCSWKPLWKDYTFDVYVEVKNQKCRPKYYHIYSVPLFSVLCVF